jgi:hypothetical protein
MALVKRNLRSQSPDSDREALIEAPNSNSRSRAANNKSKGYFNIVCTLLVTLALVTFLLIVKGAYSVQGDIGRGPVIHGDGYDVSVQFHLSKMDSATKLDGPKIVSLGPHRVIVHTNCPISPTKEVSDGSASVESDSASSIYLQVGGDALVNVPLEMVDSNRWEGSFDVPISGHYHLQPTWFGCGHGNVKELDLIKEGIMFQAKGETVSEEKEEDSLFVKGAWIKSSLVKSNSEEKLNAKYTWVNPRGLKKEVTVLKGSETSLVVKEGIVKNEESYQNVSDLDNYELVCWIGSESAEESFTSFRHLRPQIFGGQRPFKFHYDVITNYVEPDKEWVENAKEIFRKCKQILISIDEPVKELSQLEYRDQLTTFIKHLLNAFQDDTFPIWIFTSAETPQNTTNCHSPFLTRTTEHPCNEVLKDMFRESPFPSRVQLLDNTDLTFNYRQHDDINSIIAMRIFVMIGKQVTAWRAANQRGDINGLYRNGKLEPNFTLVPYKWTTKFDMKNNTR